jgi:ferredoxin
MVIITLQREKCIGCNYCVELAYERWRMSKKDGKTNLLGSVNRKGFHTVKVGDIEYDENIRAADACPVKIIKVKQI